jgi:hypothetical protein
MAAGDDGRQAGLRPSRRINTLPILSMVTLIPASRAQPITLSALAVEVGEGQTAAAALRRGADLREIH